MKRIVRITLLAAALALLWVIGRPVVFLGYVAWRDGRIAKPETQPGRSDASRLDGLSAVEVVAVDPDPTRAEAQLVALVRRVRAAGGHIAISGARHTMGGHTIHPGGVTLDMLPFNRMALDPAKRQLIVGAGARWAEVIPYLDQHGLAVQVMQSNNDFSVGGSLSANAHGWQNDLPPIAATVESIRLLTADGAILNCSRSENAELFSLTLGGYGLFGVIIEAVLHVVPNDFYQADSHRVSPEDYDRRYRELTASRDDVRMAYGRLSVAPDTFLSEGVLTLLRRSSSERAVAGTLTDLKSTWLQRLVFRSGVGSAYGKNLRWWLETRVGQTAGLMLSRNQIMNAPSDHFATRDPEHTDILHEYFLPIARFDEFVAKIRPVLLKHRPELLNITVRNVKVDQDSFLRYATEDVYGLVMLFDQRRDEPAEVAMEALTRELIEVALDCGGRYYLPYRLHASPEQFRRAYPQGADFFALKRKYDPNEVFSNTFYLNFSGG